MFFRKIKQLNPLEGYNLWAKTYANEENPIKNYSDELITNWLKDLKGKAVLDVGCGTGKFCQLAVDRGANRVVGIDLSPNMIETARRNCAGAELKIMDVSKEKIDGHFDVVICGLVLGHISDLSFVLLNLVGSLTPNGTLLITDFHQAQTLKGAKRTFKDEWSKQVIEIKHHLHLIEDYLEILQKGNAIVEEASDRKWQGEPVVYGIKIRKRS